MMKKIILLVCGFLSLIIGCVGMLVPILPTTPFVLLAAGCFSASSEKLLRRLEKSRLFGGFIENYRLKTGITVRRKVLTLIILWIGLAVSAVLIPKWVMLAVLGAVGIGVSIHILTIRTKKTESKPAESLPESVPETIS